MTRNAFTKLPSGISSQVFANHLIKNRLPVFIEKTFNTLNPGTDYVHNWHIAAIAHILTQVMEGKINRLIITMPPRSLKSISVSVAFPAFLHGQDPTKQIIAVSYSQDLSTKLHRDYRTILKSEWYRSAFPATRISPSKDTETEVALTKQGNRFATSIGGTLTGRGADIIIIDDPVKPSDAMSEVNRSRVNDWFNNTLSSRLNDKKNGAIIIVTQRLHADDLVGHVTQNPDHGWEVLNLPAIATEECSIPVSDKRVFPRTTGHLLHEEREPRHILDQLRFDLGSDAFEAQYQQRPVPPGGLMFKREWIRRYSHPPYSSDEDTTIIQSWDTASKTGPANDWSVCTTWLVHKNIYYLLDVFRKKLDYPSLRKAAIGLADQYRPTMILVEDTGVGTGLITNLQHSGQDVSPVTPRNTKESRASNQSAILEGGRVFFPERAHWLKEFETELLSFPGAKHDDQVDSMVQALAYEIPDPLVIAEYW